MPDGSSVDRIESDATAVISRHVDDVKQEVERKAAETRDRRELLLALANQPAAVRRAAERLLMTSRLRADSPP